MKRILFSIVCISLLLSAYAKAGESAETKPSENEPGTYKITGEFKGVSFSREVVGVVNDEPQYAYAGVSGSGVLKNDKDEVIAEGGLQAVEGLLGLRAKRDATFFCVPLQEKYSSPDWTQKSTSQFASLRYGKDNRWQVMDANFFFLIKPGSFGSVSLEPTASITRQSVIHLPAGNFKMFGYKIESSKDSGNVKFSYGKVVSTTDCTATADGAEVNAKKTDDDATALVVAAEKGQIEVVKLLLEKGADVNAKDNSGATALIVASETGRTEVVKSLLEKGAEVNARAKNGVTALWMASQKGHTEVVKLLLEKGADVNVKNTTNGGTALMMTAQNGHTEVVKLLLEKGADVNVKTNDGKWTALGLAKQTGRTDIVQLLEKAGAKE